MKKSVCLVLFILMVVFLSSSVFAQQQGEYKKIYRLGVASLVKDGVKTVEKLRSVIIKETDVIDLLLGGQKELVEEFYRQFPQVKIDEFFGRFKAEKMSWRDFDKKPRVTGRVDCVVDYIGGKKIESFVFEMKFYQIQKSYWFLTPKDCGNISLWKIEELEIIEEEKIKEFPPRISEPPVQQKPKPPEPEPPAIIKKEGRISYSAGMAIGGFYSCFENYFAVEFGAKRKLLDGLDLMATIRVGMPVGSDAEKWNTVPMINFGLIGRILDPFYLGAGVGFSGKMKEGQNSQAEFSATMGFYIKNIDFFFEGRTPFKGDPRGIRGNYKILVGCRMFFGK